MTLILNDRAILIVMSCHALVFKFEYSGNFKEPPMSPGAFHIEK